jgi:hypothetical protein
MRTWYICDVDIEIFKLLKAQSVDTFALLIASRELAAEKGLKHDVEEINNVIAENKTMLALANHQLSELKHYGAPGRLGFFDTI